MSRYLFIALLLCTTYPQPSSAQNESDDSAPVKTMIATSIHGVAGVISLTEVPLIAPDVSSDSSELERELRPEIHRQLQYLVGNLHGIEGGLELHDAHIFDVEKLEKLEEDLARYQYSAEINGVIVKSSAPAPGERADIRVFLPERTDDASIQSLFDDYSADCVPNSLRTYKSETYWYDFRPNAFYCPLSDWDVEVHPEHLIKMMMTFEAAPLTTVETYPEYDAVWSDGKLVVTGVYALVGGLLAEQGQESYQIVFEEMVRTYGAPISINDPTLLDLNHIGTDTPVIDATFETPRGPLEVHLFLINSLDTPSHKEGDALKSFVKDYNELSKTSDLIIYNGHAHHGADNARLDAIGVFAPERYQVFFVNTCASYTYGLPRVRQRILDLNQDMPDPEAFLDMIVNGMPAMGHEIAYMNQRYIKALVDAKDSYQTILSDMYAQQQMLVLYDQDNWWTPGLTKGDLGQRWGASSEGYGDELLPVPESTPAQGGCGVISVSSALRGSPHRSVWPWLMAVLLGVTRRLRSRAAHDAL